MNTAKYSKAYWLLQNTTLTFDQIADYCEILPIEVKAIADGQSKLYTLGYNLIQIGELTQEEIDRCQADSESRLRGSLDLKPKKTRKRKKKEA